jgi:putative membrane protein
MILDAALAYFHFIAIFLLFSSLVTQAVLLRRAPDAAGIRLLGRIDLFYLGAALAVLVTGFLRLVLGAKGADFYLASWPIYVKIALFLLIGVISVSPTLAFIRWRRYADHDAGWQVPPAEHAKARKLVVLEVHLAALIPVFAVIMARGLDR